MKKVEFIWQSKTQKDPSKLGGWHWLRSVIDFNDTKHCKYCLVGRDCKIPKPIFSNKEYEIVLQEHNDELTPSFRYNGEVMHYYCFVSQPYFYARNLHIPFIYKEGSIASAERYDGDKIIIRNAEILPFSDIKAKALYSNLGKYFTTCRNFQFAVEYFR